MNADKTTNLINSTFYRLHILLVPDNLPKFTARSWLLYCCAITLLFWGGLIVSAQLVTAVFPAASAAKDNLSYQSLGWIIYVCIVGPVVETLFLLLCLTVSKKFFLGKWTNAAVSALPISLMHAFPILGKVVIVMGPFMMMAYIFAELRKTLSPLQSLLFITGVHAGANSLTVVVFN